VTLFPFAHGVCSSGCRSAQLMCMYGAYVVAVDLLALDLLSACT
jgi:hypothetical protein